CIYTQSVMMANTVLRPQVAIDELGAEDGFLIFDNQNGNIRVDASNCKVLVYLNNQPLESSALQENDLLRIGHSIWHVSALTPGRVNKKNLSSSFSGLLGLENLQRFKLKNIFSEVLSKHSVEEMEEQLITGAGSHIPYLNNIEIGWGKPQGCCVLKVITFAKKDYGKTKQQFIRVFS
ncbi:MAG: hypothetical protein ACRDE2_17620, partial [Chitinophagaceae bacterium]